MKPREQILFIIKKNGPQTAKSIAQKLDLTSMGARLHLQKLEEQGLLSTYIKKVKVGRPNRYWKLNNAAENHFTDNHHLLSLQLIESIDEVYGCSGIDKLIKVREDKIIKKYEKALSKCTNLEDKIIKLCQIREQEGYIASIEKIDKDFILTENHCPICHAAQACPKLCESEQRVFAYLLKDIAILERTEHIIAGQRRCSYKIIPKH